MKRFQLFICVFAITQLTMAQLFGPSQLINEEAGHIYEIRSADFDNDGFEDIAIAAYNLVAWYRNLDGQGNFSPPISIQEDMGQAFNFTLADIDNDDNIDVVVSFFDEDVVVWYKNNGDGTFSSLQSIASGLISASGVVASDLDQDGDLDLVLGVSNGNGLYWVENLDGEGNFGPLIVIDATITQARNQVVEDIDGDGDVDILTNSTGDHILSWFENVDGQGDFSIQHIIETEGQYENYIYLADLDGDEDLDIVTYGETLFWRENVDGQGNFVFKEIINSVSIGGITNSPPTDIDNDNDLDLLLGTLEDFRLGWQENLDGFGNFGPVNVIDSTLYAPSNIHAEDLDNDGDLDLVVGSFIESGSSEKKLMWYENYTILGLEDLDIQHTVLYPNPATTVLSINKTNYIKQIVFYTTLGQKLVTVTNGFKQIDISGLPSGLLFVVIETELGKLIKKVIKE